MYLGVACLKCLEVLCGLEVCHLLRANETCVINQKPLLSRLCCGYADSWANKGHPGRRRTELMLPWWP